jgi:hypothetical protein
VTVLKPSLNLFGDFLEISAARGQAFASVRQDAEGPHVLVGFPAPEAAPL